MLAENPKMFAHQIAEGLLFLNLHTVQKLAPSEHRLLVEHLHRLEIEIRAEFCEPNDFRHIQKKNQKLQHIRSALHMLQHSPATPHASHKSPPHGHPPHDTKKAPHS